MLKIFVHSKKLFAFQKPSYKNLLLYKHVMMYISGAALAVRLWPVHFCKSDHTFSIVIAYLVITDTVATMVNAK